MMSAWHCGVLGTSADIIPAFKLYILRMASQQRGGASGAAPSAGANVKVVCRFRPLNEKEKALGALHCHELLDDKTLSIKDKDQKDKEPLKFTFDKIFDVNTNQSEVYSYAAASIIDSVIEGFNGTIFAYGQTASGKTHTMQGAIGEAITEHSGIIPRMVKHVFDSIAGFYENVEFRIKVSLVQLYMEKLKDLLDSNKNDLKIRSDKKRGIFIEDLTENYISSMEEVYKLIEIARNCRSIAATNMNQRSSRSHMIFILTISQNNTVDLTAKTGKLYLVDLAGSEKISKTGAEGKTLDEAKKINASLTTLGKVINALTDGKSTHIPYRDSKLTRVLQESLGGNSKTTLIVTCSPHPNNLAETISTLRFGISAKKIKNTPKINKQLTVAELQALLDKSEKELQSRGKYIEQLKNYILVDLKQKSVPDFETEKNIVPIEENDNDYLTQLQRQLEMEKNLHIVQDEQINSLKIKCDQITNEKDDLEREIETLRAEVNARTKELKEVRQTTARATTSDQTPVKVSTHEEFIRELQKITSDEKVLNFMSQLPESKAKSEELGKMLEEYQQEKEKRKKAEDNLAKYERNMQKKLVQLENNICQLTHAYYDLVVVQQRYKVDNIFIKKELETKDITIQMMKEKIKDLEDQNRELEEGYLNEDDRNNQPTLKEGFEESNRKFEKKMEEMKHKPNVVKVLKGGLK